MDGAVERGNGRYVRWSTIGVIGGICAAIIVPLTTIGIAWGTISAKVDGLTDAAKQANERAQKSDDAINNLNVSVARLSSAVDALTQRIAGDRRAQP